MNPTQKTAERWMSLLSPLLKEDDSNDSAADTQENGYQNP